MSLLKQFFKIILFGILTFQFTCTVVKTEKDKKKFFYLSSLAGIPLVISGNIFGVTLKQTEISLKTPDGKVLQSQFYDTNKFSFVGNWNISDGYLVCAKGGLMPTSDPNVWTTFNDELCAYYPVVSNEANVSPITTIITGAVKACVVQDKSTYSNCNQSTLSFFELVGAIKQNDYNKENPSLVDKELIGKLIFESKVSAYANLAGYSMLSKNIELQLMNVFKDAHGSVSLFTTNKSEERIITNSETPITIEPNVKLVKSESKIEYSTKTNTPGISIDSSTGKIAIDSATVGTNNSILPVTFIAKNKDTGFYRELTVNLFVSNQVTKNEIVLTSTKRTATVNNVTFELPDTETLDVKITFTSGLDDKGMPFYTVDIDRDADITITMPEILEQGDSNLMLNKIRRNIKASFSSTNSCNSNDDFIINQDWRLYSYLSSEIKKEETNILSSMLLPKTSKLLKSIKKIIWIETKSYKLLSNLSIDDLATSDNYLSQITKNENILYIHGFDPSSTNNSNMKNQDLNIIESLILKLEPGSYGTWGQNPCLMKESLKNINLFEFRWTNYNNFEISAEKLFEAINKIYKKTGKGVHIVAHSFGGVLARTYLQKNIVQNLNGANKRIKSLTTISSPHSGIYMAANDEFPIGIDSNIIPVCPFPTCLQMGSTSNNKDIFIKNISNVSNNLFPKNLSILVIIGKEIESTKSSWFSSKYIYTIQNGDNLISEDGQRFFPFDAIKKYPFRGKNDNKCLEDGFEFLYNNFCLKEVLIGKYPSQSSTTSPSTMFGISHTRSGANSIDALNNPLIIENKPATDNAYVYSLMTDHIKENSGELKIIAPAYFKNSSTSPFFYENSNFANRNSSIKCFSASIQGRIQLDDKPISNTDLTWKSSNSSLLALGSDGCVFATGKITDGSTEKTITITAEYGEIHQATFSIKVKEKSTTIAMTISPVGSATTIHPIAPTMTASCDSTYMNEENQKEYETDIKMAYSTSNAIAFNSSGAITSGNSTSFGTVADNSISGQFTATGSGDVTYYFGCADGSGNVATPQTHLYKIDGPPSIPTISSNNGSTVSNANITLSLNASDSYGLDGFYVGPDSNCGTFDTSISGTTNFSRPSHSYSLALGSNTIYFCVRDISGYISKNQTAVSYQQTPPSASILSVTTCSSQGANVTFSLDCYSNSSSIAGYYFGTSSNRTDNGYNSASDGYTKDISVSTQRYYLFCEDNNNQYSSSATYDVSCGSGGTVDPPIDTGGTGGSCTPNINAFCAIPYNILSNTYQEPGYQSITCNAGTPVYETCYQKVLIWNSLKTNSRTFIGYDQTTNDPTFVVIPYIVNVNTISFKFFKPTSKELPDIPDLSKLFTQNGTAQIQDVDNGNNVSASTNYLLNSDQFNLDLDISSFSLNTTRSFRIYLESQDGFWNMYSGGVVKIKKVRN